MSAARIMIVEDERITAESVKCTLEDLGYAVCAIVATGPEAVARAGSERPDLVLMDIVLRGAMDGIEAAEQIRTAYSIPIVYATAYADEPFLRRARVTAPYGYILKPFTIRELHSNIEMALHKSRLDRQIARLNAVLDTIRRVNQCVVREHGRDRLLQRVCEILVAHGGYTFAWTALFDAADKLLGTAEAGFGGDGFRPMVELLRQGTRPSCFQKISALAGRVLVSLRAGGCGDCPLRDRYADVQALAVRFGSEGPSPGLLFAGVPATVRVDETECQIFSELADDISVALHAINADAERARTEQALRHAQKMEAVGQLAAGVAHDFNNLLTAIYGYTDLAAQALPPEHRAQEPLRGIEVAVRHATGVARGLLTFSGRSAAHKETVNLPHLVRDSARLLRHLLPALITLEVDAPEEPALFVHADPTQLQQVLMNLAVNARDAMPDGGRLRIAVSTVPPPGPPAAAPAQPMACVTVSDTGCGMTPEVQARIFDPFYTTKPRGRGTGLGLAIIHSIVQEHGGALAVDSAPEHGSTFYVRLPCVPGASTAGPAADRPAKSRGHGELVLLAEDDRYVREIIATVLKDSQYSVLQARDGVELWTLYTQRRAGLRLLIVDVDLPQRSGLDCLRAIRQTGDRVPAIVITAQSEVQLTRTLTDCTLLRKPFPVSELIQLVGRTIDTVPLQERTT